MNERGGAGAIAGARIAFATHAGSAAGTDDDRLAAAALEARHGCRVEPVRWDDDGDWRRFAAVVIRSTWDYHLRLPAFIEWLGRLDSLGVRVWNPAPVVGWNADKRYLRALQRAGVPVVPTAWLEAGAAVDLAGLLGARGWPHAVVKPAVSATAFRTWRVDAERSADGDQRIAELLRDGAVLVQPFMTEVQQAGEWSFVFFASEDGRLGFNHAALKQPIAGEFRVQPEFGGTARAAAPHPRLLEQARAIAATVERLAPGPLLYARLDGIVSAGAQAPAGALLLMEAELIEPLLFLGEAPGAPRHFADAVAGRLAGSAATPR